MNADWKTIDTLPKDEWIILGWDFGGAYSDCIIGKVTKDNVFIEQTGSVIPGPYPTHWDSLPSPPARDEKGNAK